LSDLDEIQCMRSARHAIEQALLS